MKKAFFQRPQPRRVVLQPRVAEQTCQVADCIAFDNAHRQPIPVKGLTDSINRQREKETVGEIK